MDSEGRQEEREEKIERKQEGRERDMNHTEDKKREKSK